MKDLEKSQNDQCFAERKDDPMQKLRTIMQPPFQPLSAFSSKQISDGNNFKQTILNIIKNSKDLAITLQHLS